MRRNREDYPVRHKNGNCLHIGGFCTAVPDPICAGVRSAYECGWTDCALKIRKEQQLKSSLTIEAEPVRHGRWVIEKRHAVSRNPYIDDNYFASATCSECDFCIHAETKSFGYPDLNTTNYCPNCGAKLDLEE